MLVMVKNKTTDINCFPTMQGADVNRVYEVMMAFLKEVIPVRNGNLTLVRGQENRVSVPKPPFVMMQLIHQAALSLNENRYTDTHKVIHSMKEIEIQLDFYGTDKAPAQKMADLFMTVFNDDWAWDFFNQRTKIIHPLHAFNARNAPVISGENEYNDRYTVMAAIAYQPEIGVCQQSAREILIKTKQVK